MDWKYTPICLRFLPKYNDEPFAISGIFLILKGEDETIQSKVFLSFCNLPIADIESKYNVFVSASGLIDETDLKWIPLGYDFHSNIFNKSSKDQDKLYTSLKYFLRSGFRLIPFESRGSQDVDFLFGAKIVGFKMHASNFGHFYGSIKKSLRKIVFSRSNINSEIMIESCPYSFTNPALFVNFVSNGSVNLVLKNETQNDNGELAYISDVKYLENMIGGVVKSDEVNSIGLVFGNIRKLNGDGDLTIILSWDSILSRISEGTQNRHLQFSPLASQVHFMERALPGNEIKSTHQVLDNTNCVFPITIESLSTHRLYWGSGILLDKETLITNDHVVNVDPKRAKITVHLNKESSVVLNVNEITDKANSSVHIDQIVTPFKNLDLSFIKLSKRNQNTIASLEGIGPASQNLLNSYKVGDEVKTVGFGLFLSQHVSQRPLSCKGIISAIAKFPIYEAIEPSQYTPSLIVTSSSCWNGSSGGGLFESGTGKLIGMICSNAEVNIPEILMEGPKSILGKTEKLSKFSLCIPIELINTLREYISQDLIHKEINTRITNAWKLLPTHEEIVIDESLKL